MKRGKEWFKEQVSVMGFEESQNYPHDRIIGTSVVIDLIDQLDEPEKIVIPNIVAEAFEEFKETTSYVAQLIDKMYNSSDEVGYWLEVPSNEKLILRAWLGESYEAEKEKLYRVIIPTNGTTWEYYYLDDDGGIDMSDTLHFVHRHTEQFIRSISDELWAFAEEVAE